MSNLPKANSGPILFKNRQYPSGNRGCPSEILSGIYNICLFQADLDQQHGLFCFTFLLLATPSTRMVASLIGIFGKTALRSKDTKISPISYSSRRG